MSSYPIDVQDADGICTWAPIAWTYDGGTLPDGITVHGEPLPEGASLHADGTCTMPSGTLDGVTLAPVAETTTVATVAPTVETTTTIAAEPPPPVAELAATGPLTSVPLLAAVAAACITGGWRLLRKV